MSTGQGSFWPSCLVTLYIFLLAFAEVSSFDIPPVHESILDFISGSERVCGDHEAEGQPAGGSQAVREGRRSARLLHAVVVVAFEGGTP